MFGSSSIVQGPSLLRMLSRFSSSPPPLVGLGLSDSVHSIRYLLLPMCAIATNLQARWEMEAVLRLLGLEDTKRFRGPVLRVRPQP